MAVLTSEPPRPAVHSAPPPSLVIRNIHYKEYIGAITFGVGTFLLGKFHKQPRKLQAANKWIFGITGFMGALCIAFERSSQRLMGWKENDAEVAKYPYRLDTLTHQKYRTVPE